MKTAIQWCLYTCVNPYVPFYAVWPANVHSRCVYSVYECRISHYARGFYTCKLQDKVVWERFRQSIGIDSLLLSEREPLRRKHALTNAQGEPTESPTQQSKEEEPEPTTNKNGLPHRHLQMLAEAAKSQAPRHLLQHADLDRGGNGNWDRYITHTHTHKHTHTHTHTHYL